MKTWTISLFLLLFALNSFAQISDYNVTNPYNWDNIFAIDGNVKTTSPTTTICDFYIYDVNHTLIYRLDSQYATASGHFSSNPITLRTPPFIRGHDYNAVTNCGPHSINQTFSIIQRKDMENSLYFEYSWFMQPENLIPAGLCLALILVALFAYNFLRRS